jgi:mannonate dehydratase
MDPTADCVNADSPYHRCMRIGLVLTPPTDLFFRWAAQVGVTDFVARYPGAETFESLSGIHARAASFGLRLSVIKGYLPLDKIILGQSGRDEQIAEISRVIVHMGRLGIPVLCYNFMLADWTRTDTNVVTRGGAITSGFDLNRMGDRMVPADRRVTSEQLWQNLEYFLRRVVPVAETSGVKLAMHPDDPPLPALMGAAQIMHEPAAFERLGQLVPSPANGMCFCQGTFAEMGVDIPATIRRLARIIHYVHFRDVRGTAVKFEETFHDDGQTDMAAAMRAYHEIGFTGVMRPDHVPRLDDEAGDGSGYSMLARLFAVGYIRGLMHAVEGRHGD